METFNAGEVLQFAVGIEENGETFYRRLAERFTDEKARTLFVYLADEEVEHRKTFEAMVSRVASYQPPESYPPEYFSYLRAFVNDVIFDEQQLETQLKGIRDIVGALDFGVRRELDSIFYYEEMRKLVPGDELDVIDAIIAEERKHFLRLHELKTFFRNKK